MLPMSSNTLAHGDTNASRNGRVLLAAAEANHAGQLQCCATGDIAEYTPSAATAPGFLDWDVFDEATLPPRANVRRSRLSRVLSPLKSVKAELPGNVSVEGLSGLIESAHGVFHSVRRLDFMETERTIYLMPTPDTQTRRGLSRRELERLENELFDLSKYKGPCCYLTALTWTEESLSGSITLYQVVLGDGGETVVGIRPVAAMRDVPSSVLVNMRTDNRVKRKIVFAPGDEDDQSPEWRANPSEGPRYVEFSHTGRPASPLRSPSRSRSRHRGVGLADADGVCATMPQFVALLHARRSILEAVKSSGITAVRMEDGVAKRVVVLTQSPRSDPHEGDGVHIAVLVPNDAPWVEEAIIWTDQTGLAEFRQRQYWNLTERGRLGRGRSMSRRRD